MKRIDLRLPKDHLLFSFPAGARNAAAIILLDVGENLLKIEERLSKIEAKLSKHSAVDIIADKEEKPVQNDQDKITHSIMEGFGLLD